MKAKLVRKTIATGLTLGMVWAMTAVADGTSANQNVAAPQRELDTYKGTIATLNGTEKTITVDGFWTTKTFNTAENCTVTTGHTLADLADLRPGQKVEVGYEKLDGVLIAKRIDQRNTIYEGRIARLDLDNRILEISDNLKSREFELPTGCPVVLHDNESGALKDLQIGQRVKVLFESPPDSPYQAVKIVQDYETFTGTIRAIDADRKTVKAKTLLSEKKFNLARDCKVILTDNAEGTLRDLRIGDQVEFSYEDADGVLVANLITQETSAEGSTAVQVSAPRGTAP